MTDRRSPLVIPLSCIVTSGIFLFLDDIFNVSHFHYAVSVFDSILRRLLVICCVRVSIYLCA